VSAFKRIPGGHPWVPPPNLWERGGEPRTLFTGYILGRETLTGLEGIPEGGNPNRGNWFNESPLGAQKVKNCGGTPFRMGPNLGLLTG